MRTELRRFNGALERDPAIEAWMKAHADELGAIVLQWFEVLRKCGDEECIHYARKRGIFHGAALPNPAGLLHDTGTFMRHMDLPFSRMHPIKCGLFDAVS